VKKYIYCSALFFIYGIVAALINVLTIGLIFNMKNYSIIHAIILIILIAVPIVGFFLLLLKVFRHLKEQAYYLNVYQRLVIVLIALGFTVLPYYVI